MSEKKKTNISNLIEKTICEMVAEERLGINTEYTILIRDIITLYYSLYNSSKIENEDKISIAFISKEIATRGNDYVKNIIKNKYEDMGLDGDKEEDLLNYKCHELVDKYVNIWKLHHIMQNS